MQFVRAGSHGSQRFTPGKQLYTTKVLTEMLGVKFGELRTLFKQELGAERARNLKEQMLAAGLPV